MLKKLFSVLFLIFFCTGILWAKSIKKDTIEVPSQCVGVYVPLEKCETANGEIIPESCIKFEPSPDFIITEKGMQKTPDGPIYKLVSIKYTEEKGIKWISLKFESNEYPIVMTQVDDTHWTIISGKKDSSDPNNYFLFLMAKYPLDAIE